MNHEERARISYQKAGFALLDAIEHEDGTPSEIDGTKAVIRENFTPGYLNERDLHLFAAGYAASARDICELLQEMKEGKIKE